MKFRVIEQIYDVEDSSGLNVDMILSNLWDSGIVISRHSSAFCEILFRLRKSWLPCMLVRVSPGRGHCTLNSYLWDLLDLHKWYKYCFIFVCQVVLDLKSQSANLVFILSFSETKFTVMCQVFVGVFCSASARRMVLHGGLIARWTLVNHAVVMILTQFLFMISRVDFSWNNSVRSGFRKIH